MTTRGSIGNIALFKNLPFKSALINAQMLIFRSDNQRKLSSEYLYYLLTSDLLKNNLLLSHQDQHSLNYQYHHLKLINLVIPPLQEQKAISQALLNLDKKIES